MKREEVYCAENNYISSFMPKVYAWMGGGLFITALMSILTITTPLLLNMIYSPLLFVLIIAELFLVFYLSRNIKKLSTNTAISLFVAYAALNGVTLTAILMVYTETVIYNAFLTTAGMFSLVSIYGYFTKRDLSSWGHFFIMGVIGIIIASIVNIFFISSVLHMVISYLGVFIFVGLTAYDTQKIKNMALSSNYSEKITIIGALTLYLDFINLFLFILRVTGGNRD